MPRIHEAREGMLWEGTATVRQQLAGGLRRVCQCHKLRVHVQDWQQQELAEQSRAAGFTIMLPEAATAAPLAPGPDKIRCLPGAC